MADYTLEFYTDEHGDQPVYRWLREELAPHQRWALGTAMREVLQTQGVAVCGTRFGRQLHDGLFEFRLGGTVGDFSGTSPPPGIDPNEELLLRVFCHAHGNRLILLLGGYDKLKHTSASYQDGQIAIARSRLTAWELAQKKAGKIKRRAGSS